jgi:hypothetical protein
VLCVRAAPTRRLRAFAGHGASPCT